MRRVVKLGGSLLGQPGVFARLTSWLALVPDAATLILVGGGRAVDWWRDLDQIHGLDPQFAHDAALAVMAQNARVVVAHLPHIHWVTQLPAAGGEPSVGVIDPLRLLTRLEQRHPPLPRSWEVSSDSIAAWVACCWAADELVLLKSCQPPGDASSWSQHGFTDEYFIRVGFPLTKISTWNLADAGS